MNNWTELSADKQEIGGRGNSSEGKREVGVVVLEMHIHSRRQPASEELWVSFWFALWQMSAVFWSDKYQNAVMVSETIFDPAKKWDIPCHVI